MVSPAASELCTASTKTLSTSPSGVSLKYVPHTYPSFERQNMNAVEVKYSLYVETMKRTRWMLLTTTILSCLILMHVYLEQFSASQAQMLEVLRVRKVTNLSNEVNSLEKLIDEIRSKPGDNQHEIDQQSRKYAQLKYRITLGDNMLKNATIPERSLPLLSFAVPGNDFLPVAGTMLLIFVIAVWLSLRSVVAALQSLQTTIDDSLRELIRLQFTFTGLHDKPSAERTLVQAVQYLAFLLPPISFLIATSIDVWSVLSVIGNAANRGTAGPAGTLISRYIYLFMELIILLVITVVSMVKIQEMSRLAEET
jgi:hypothetical protein